MPVIKNDGKGVYYRNGQWFYKTYNSVRPERGPFKTRTEAMERLLNNLGFDVHPVQRLDAED